MGSWTYTHTHAHTHRCIIEHTHILPCVLCTCIYLYSVGKISWKMRISEWLLYVQVLMWTCLSYLCEPNILTMWWAKDRTEKEPLMCDTSWLWLWGCSFYSRLNHLYVFWRWKTYWVWKCTCPLEAVMTSVRPESERMRLVKLFTTRETGEFREFGPPSSGDWP